MDLLTIIVLACVGLVTCVVLAAVFGPETARDMIRNAFDKLRGGGAPVLLLSAILLTGGCAAFPKTTAAYNEGGLGAATDTFFAQVHLRVVTICTFDNGSRRARTIEFLGKKAAGDRAVDRIKKTGKDWCAGLGGEELTDVQAVNS
ncbi:MAG: hypothetical protein AAGD13_25410 [Pseudomonadota bacterium]